MKRWTVWRERSFSTRRASSTSVLARSYFDNVRHDRLLAKVAQRVGDADVMHLLKIMLKASGKHGVPQGGVISPLLSNIYLTEVDRMLERAREWPRATASTPPSNTRDLADDLVILIDAHQRHDWLMAAVEKRLREELAELQVEINEEKRFESWTSAEARASAFWGSTSAECVVCGAYGAPTTRPSSKSGRRCYASSRMCSAATNRNRLIGS